MIYLNVAWLMYSMTVVLPWATDSTVVNPLIDRINQTQERTVGVANTQFGGRWTLSRDIPRSIGWEKLNQSLVFTLVGPSGGYTAMAISQDAAMGPADDCYICAPPPSSSPPGPTLVPIPDFNLTLFPPGNFTLPFPLVANVEIKSAYLRGPGPPVLSGELADIGISMLIATNFGPIQECSFIRPLSVTKFVEDGEDVTWDLTSTPFHLAYADGSLDDEGNPDYSGTTWEFTADALQLNKAHPPSATTPMPEATTTDSPSIHPETLVPEPNPTNEAPATVATDEPAAAVTSEPEPATTQPEPPVTTASTLIQNTDGNDGGRGSSVRSSLIFLASAFLMTCAAAGLLQ